MVIWTVLDLHVLILDRTEELGPSFIIPTGALQYRPDVGSVPPNNSNCCNILVVRAGTLVVRA